MRITDKFVFFHGGVFSQWHPCSFVYEDFKYNCAEQAMMHRKAICFGDFTKAKEIMEAPHPRDHKALGRMVKHFDAEHWNRIARNLVADINYQKFTSSHKLKRALLETEDRIIVEASPFDLIWGVGLDENHPAIEDPTRWKGDNWLGQCLMTVRTKISREVNGDKSYYEWEFP